MLALEVDFGELQQTHHVRRYIIAKRLELLPIQFIGVLGSIIAVLGLVFAVFLIIRRLIVGPELEGTFTLFGILFFFIGVQIFALGVIGEYIGRIYQEVRRRPRFVIKKELF